MWENCKVLISTPVIDDPGYSFIMQERLIFLLCVVFMYITKMTGFPFLLFIKTIFLKYCTER